MKNSDINETLRQLKQARARRDKGRVRQLEADLAHHCEAARTLALQAFAGYPALPRKDRHSRTQAV